MYRLPFRCCRTLEL
uniref:Uncharacterized protein n=1 Tax=Arundo donax TaxID=35708 RepID=A0A0A9FUX0_ARUDO